MRKRSLSMCCAGASMLLWSSVVIGQPALIQVKQDFSGDPGWENMNNRIEPTDPPTISQDFGWSATNHLGAGTGELGGEIWRSRTIAYYAMPLGKPLTFKDRFSASGKIMLMPCEKTGGAYIGFFNHERQEWRPWSSMAWRLGDYPRGAELHMDYMTATWMANGVRLPVILPADGSVHSWRMSYDPDATINPDSWPHPALPQILTGQRQKESELFAKAKEIDSTLTVEAFHKQLEAAQDCGLAGSSRLGDFDAWWKNSNPQDSQGAFSFQLDDGRVFRMFLLRKELDEPVMLDRFGIFNFQLYGRHWEFYDNESTGTNCRFYMGDLTVNDAKIDLSRDPGWEGAGNRASFVDHDFHGRHNFGYNQTNWAGRQPGEIGGTIWRNEAIDPLHAYYADNIGTLSLDDPILFEGELCFVDGATDGDVYIGYFNKDQRLTSFTGGLREYPANLAELKGGRRNIHLGFDGRASQLPGTMGITIGGPTRIGFYFNAFCAPTVASAKMQNGPVIHPDRKRRHFRFDYDPAGNSGGGRITATLDGKQFVLDLTPEMRKAGATFDHFGISSIRQGGKWVTVYLDDLVYTARRAPGEQPVQHEQTVTTVPYPVGGRRY